MFLSEAQGGLKLLASLLLAVIQGLVPLFPGFWPCSQRLTQIAKIKGLCHSKQTASIYLKGVCEAENLSEDIQGSSRIVWSFALRNSRKGVWLFRGSAQMVLYLHQ